MPSRASTFLAALAFLGCWVAGIQTASAAPPTITTPISDVTVDEDPDPGAAALSINLNSAFGGATSYSVFANSNSSLVSTSFSPNAHTLRLTIAANASGSANITVRATNADGSTNDSFLVTVNPVNDPPVAVDDTATTTENSAVSTNVILNDTDVDDTVSELSLKNSGGDEPALVSATDGGGGAIVIADPSLSIQVSGNEVRFDPRQDFDFLKEGESATVVISYTVQDSIQGGELGGVQQDDGTLTITVTGTNDEPEFGSAGESVVNEFSMKTNRTLRPFQGLTITDLDAATLTLTVTLTGIDSSAVSGTMVDPGGLLQDLGGNSWSFTLTGSDSAALSEMMTEHFQQLEYHSQAGALPSSQELTICFEYKIEDELDEQEIACSDPGPAPGMPDLRKRVVVEGAPLILKTQADQVVNDGEAITPFKLVELQNPAGGNVRVAVTLEPDSRGLLKPTTQFPLTSTSPRTLTFTGGNAGAATTALRQLVFDPSENLLFDEEVVRFTIVLTLASTNEELDNNSETTVRIVPVNDAPDIVGIGNTRTTDDTPINPFRTVEVIDVDEDGGQELTIRIRMEDPAQGSFEGTSPIQRGGQITQYTGSAMTDPVTVYSPAHGLQSGDLVRIFGYGGDSSYNAVHAVTVTGADRFTIPIDFVDNNAGKGYWIRLTAIAEYQGVDGASPVTVVSAEPHGLVADDELTIGGYGGASTAYNGVHIVAAVPVAGGAPSLDKLEIDIDFEDLSAVIPSPALGGWIPGAISGAGTYNKVLDLGNGVLQVSGTPEEVTGALRALIFVPEPNRQPVGGNETVAVVITVNDGLATRNARVEIVVDSVNGSPVITVPAVQPAQVVDLRPLRPFDAGNANVLVEDEVDDVLTIRVRADDPDKGVFFAPVLPAGADPAALAAAPVTVSGYEDDNGHLRVTSNGHGLAPGDLVAISGYGGAGFYNGVHEVLAADADHFTVPAFYRDDVTPRGSWIQVEAFEEEFEFTGAPAMVTAVLHALIFELSDSYPFPPDNPGGMTFTLEVTDLLENLASETLAITLIIEPKTWIVTTTADDGAGSLREAIEDLAGPNDQIVFGFPMVAGEPLAITLESEIAIGKHLTIYGPGADQLIITGTGSSRLFSVNSFVTIRGLTLQGGSAATFGGAIGVEELGNLHLLDCDLRYNVSAQWGGAVDVGGVFGGGALTVERCLFLGNATDQVLGRGGGAISLYTDQPCLIMNSTFSGNQQGAASGTGGGAIYAENSTPGVEFPLFVLNCTFTANQDAANQGSSLHSRSFNTQIWVKNDIFADGAGKNLEVAVSGRILSLGGNISDDATLTVFTQNWTPRLIALLDPSKDRLSQSSQAIGLQPLADNKGPTRTHMLSASSVAKGYAVRNRADSPITKLAIEAAEAAGIVLTPAELAALPLSLDPGTDQRGIWRNWTGSVDSGAVQTGGFKRLVINEVAFDPAGGQANEFVEFYNPRSSEPIDPDDVKGFQLLTGGTVRHEFPALVLDPLLTALDPGLGFVVAASAGVKVPGADPAATPPRPAVPLQIASSGGLFLDDRRDAVVLKNNLGQVLEWVSYVGTFATGGSLNPAYLAPAAHQSVTQYPEFMGGFLPHKLAMVLKTGQTPTTTEIEAFDPSSPGKDLIGVSLSGGNAPPIAVSDRFELSEDTLASLDVLGNDLEFDRIDEIRVTSLGLASPTQPNVSSLTTSPSGLGRGAVVSIENGGASLAYDPLDPIASLTMQELMEGELLIDEFYYTIIDRVAATGVDYPQGASERNLATTLVTLEVTGVNDPPQPADRQYATAEDQPLRILVDETLLDVNPNFDFEDVPPGSVTLAAQALLPQHAHALDLVNAAAVGDLPAAGKALVVVGEVGMAGLQIRIFDWRGNLAADVAESSLPAGKLPALAGLKAFLGTPLPDEANLSSNALALVLRVAAHLADYDGLPDYDIDKDDDNSSLVVSAVSAVGSVAGDADFTTLTTTSSCGAAVRLDFRFRREESNIVYDPSTSSALNRLAFGETVIDSFQYSLRDRHGAIRVATILVEVTGVNDGPQAVDDNLGIATDEDTILEIEAGDLLANDTDPDTNFGHPEGTIANPDIPGTALGDVLEIQGVVGATSTLGAAISWDAGAGVVRYDPSNAPTLQALARDELLVEPVEDSFDYIMEDERGVTSIATVRLGVVGVNDTPTAVDDPDYTTLEDVLLDVPAATGLLANDLEIDINGFSPDDHLWVIPNSEIQTLKDALVFIQQDGSFTFDPRQSAIFNALGEADPLIDSFDYTIIDNSLTQAINDVFSVQADTGNHSLAILANDRILPADGGQLSIAPDLFAEPDKGGLAEVSPDGLSLVYTPLTNFVGVERFAYRIFDGLGGTDTAWVSVNVIVDALNGNLMANDDHFTMGMGTSAVLPVLANDHVLPESGQSLFVTGVSGNEAANVTIGADRKSVVYTPGPNETGLKAFSYSVSAGGVSEPSALVEVTLVDRTGALNLATLSDGSSIFDDRFSVAEASADNTLPVLTNDFILPGAGRQLFVDRVGSPDADPLVHVTANGSSVTVNAAGDGLLYTPGVNFRGDESFTYRFTDGAGGTGDATVNITVVGEFQPNLDRYLVLQGGGAVELDVLLNDFRLGGSPQTLTLASVGLNADAPDHGGTVSKSASNKVIYQPAANFTGEEMFRYEAQDETSAIATGTVIVRVLASGAGLHPEQDRFTVVAGSEEELLDVMANDSVLPGSTGAAFISKVGPADADPQTFTTSNGSVVAVNDSGDGLLFTPGDGFGGDESFTYTLTDGTGQSASANVTVVIPGSRLIADDDRYALGAGIDGNELDVLRNDTIIPDDGVSRIITAVGLDTDSPDMSGTVVIGGAQDRLLYTPDATTQLERFKYEISDGTLARAEGEVTILIPDRTGVLMPSADVFSVEQGSGDNILQVLVNDLVFPPTGEVWRIVPPVLSPQATAEGGEFRVNASRTAILYTPAPDFIGTDTFSYEVTDGLGGTGTAVVSVKVGDLPTNSDSFVVLADSVDNPLAVLANDEILPATAVQFVLQAAFSVDNTNVRRNGKTALGGDVTISGDLVLYTPPANVPPADIPPNSNKRTERAVDSFRYEVVDDTGETVEGMATVTIFEDGSDRDTATAFVTVIGVNDAPTIDASGAVPMVITDKGVGHPFQGVVLVEVDDQGQQIIKIVVTIDNPISGVLTNLNGFVETAPGSYQFVGTAANATAALQGLVFVPMENWVTVTAPPVPEHFGFTLSIMDNDPTVTIPLTTTDSSLSIGVTAVNDPPSISGTVAGQVVYHRGEIHAFAGVVITEVDDHELQPLTIDVALDQPFHGILVSPGGAFSDLGGGLYRFTGTAAEATLAFWELLFVPTTADRLQAGLNPADSETTQFTITVDDGFGGVAIDGSTTVTAIHGYIGEVTSEDGAMNDNLGWSVGASSDFVVAGAPHADSKGNGAGAAYVFAPVTAAKDEWSQHSKLLASDGSGGDAFGTAVDIDGSFIVVGAPYEKTGPVSQGAAYVFQLQAGLWVEVEKLVPEDGASGDQFGFSVGISGDLIVVGAPHDDEGAGSSGSLYVYEYRAGSWEFLAKLNASTPTGGDQLGFSVDVSGSTIIGGAPFKSPSGVSRGSAYIFERDSETSTSWTEVTQLTPSDMIMNTKFGWSVGISEGTAVAGAPLHAENGTKTGAAYVFSESTGWGEIAKLLPPQGENTDEFGVSVDIDRGDVVVGMHNDGNAVLNQSKFGSAYIFNENEGGSNQWGLIETVVSLTPDNNDELGFSVAIGGHTAAFGIPFDNPAGTDDAGGLIIYRLKYNNGPVARLPIPTQMVGPAQPFDFVIPAGAFGDPDAWESLTYSAFESGGPLPAWLSLEPGTGRFSGTPGVSDLGDYLIEVIVTDDDGLVAESSFTLSVAVAPVQGPRAVVYDLLDFARFSVSLEPLPGRATPDDSRYVVLRFLGLAEGITESKSPYVVEVSRDLVQWERAAGYLREREGSKQGGANVRQFIWTSLSPVTGIGAQFFRIRREP